MILLPLLLAGSAAADADADPAAAEKQRRQCVALAQTDPPAAERFAAALKQGDADADECRALAAMVERRYPDAAAAFAAAARAAPREAARLWAQAGNAWLAAGDAAKAGEALNASLAATNPDPVARGEALLDRARAAVVLGDQAGARRDIDAALKLVSQDPFAWLLSATMARRMKDLPRAGTDIAEALKRAGDDPDVQLEAGNIAALGGDGDGARIAWAAAVRLGPGTPAAARAKTALAQFGEAPPPAPTAQPGR